MKDSFIRYLVLAVATGVSAFGSLLPITNGNFESASTPTNLGGGLGTIGAPGDIPGYVAIGDVGTAQPGPAEFLLPLADPTKTAYNNGGVVIQHLTSTFAADTTYTLSVQVGKRLDVPLPGLYSIAIMSNGMIIAIANNPVNPAPGTFSAASLSFDTHINPSVVGAPISFAFVSNGGGQINFDTVSIDATSNTSRITTIPSPIVTPTAPSPGAPVPEPATFAFMACGLAGLGLFGHHRSKRNLA